MRYLFWWVFAAVPTTALCLGLYAVGQQGYRQSVNDPQVQVAEDAAARLDAGEVPAALVQRGAAPVDIAASLAPWIAVYDAKGLPLESSAVLDGAPPQLPQGVFENADFWRHGHSWQPEPGVRQALVVVKTSDGKYFVAAGRNMREMERRVVMLGQKVFAGWLATIGALAVLQLCYVFVVRRAARGGEGRG